MTAFWPLFKRELSSFFVTPTAWVLIVVFLVVQGMHFYLLIDYFARQPVPSGDETLLSAFFGNTVLLYLVLFLVIPALTMRLFAEERRSGTIETLLTAPVSSASVVLAKYAAAMTTYGAMWLPTLFYVVILRRMGTVDLRATASAYLGVLLVGGGYLSLGVCASAVTRSQLVATALTSLALLSLFIVGLGEFVVREGTTAHAICAYVSVWGHMNDFASGIVDSRRVVFYGTMIVLPLYVTTRVVDAWKWG
jgi:ABC-2 type transport system permease protein